MAELGKLRNNKGFGIRDSQMSAFVEVPKSYGISSIQGISKLMVYFQLEKKQLEETTPFDNLRLEIARENYPRVCEKLDELIEAYATMCRKLPEGPILRSFAESAEDDDFPLIREREEEFEVVVPSDQDMQIAVADRAVLRLIKAEKTIAIGLYPARIKHQATSIIIYPHSKPIIRGTYELFSKYLGEIYKIPMPIFEELEENQGRAKRI